MKVDRGRDATAPEEIPLEGWLDVAARVGQRIIDDRASLAAAGVAFYGMLALFPAMAAFVSIYGLVTDPQTIRDHVYLLTGIVPSAGLELLNIELQRITSAQTKTLGASFILSFGFSLWIANNGMRALFQSMNVAYDELEKRGFLKHIGMSLALTLAGSATTMIVLNGVVALPLLFSFVESDQLTTLTGVIVPSVLLFVLVNCGIAALYRWGPSRRRAKWRWITWGSVLASVLWVLVSSCFALYLAHWDTYSATYGSLGAVIGLMMWMYISAYVIIIGAQVNAEMEHQTLVDSTVGPARPMGHRGAHVADTIGKVR